jgi:hypothetical protein
MVTSVSVKHIASTFSAEIYHIMSLATSRKVAGSNLNDIFVFFSIHLIVQATKLFWIQPLTEMSVGNLPEL